MQTFTIDNITDPYNINFYLSFYESFNEMMNLYIVYQYKSVYNVLI